MIIFKHDFIIVGLRVTVEVVYQPPIPNADNPCDLAGYCESNILSVVDLVSEQNLGPKFITENCPLLLGHLQFMIEALIKEKIDERQTLTKIGGV